MQALRNAVARLQGGVDAGRHGAAAVLGALLLAGAPAVAGAARADIHSIIVRPEALTRCFVGHGSYTGHVDDLVAAAKAAGVRAVHVEVRAADPEDPSQTGHLYFEPEPDAAILAADAFVACGRERFAANDAGMLRYLIDRLHQSGLQVYAWFPVFLDPAVYALGNAAYRSQPDDWETGFVSVFNADVRAHELELIRQTVTKLPFDGLHLDYLRYQAEEQPAGPDADAQFTALYGAPLSEVAGNRSHPLWPQFLDFRAEGLRSFTAAARTLLGGIRDLELGGFMMPHSLQSGVATGYANDPWAGIDYDRMAAIGMSLSPMVYWGEQNPGWSVEDCGSWTCWTPKILQHLTDHVANHPTSVPVPTYSLDEPATQVSQATTWAESAGIDQITFFFWGAWTDPNEHILDKLDGAMGSAHGDTDYPAVAITTPAYTTDPVPVAQGDPLMIAATVSENVEPITEASYRLDGGSWVALPAGPAPAASGIDLTGLAPGLHTVTVLVHDAGGRAGQGVAVVDVGGVTPPAPSPGCGAAGACGGQARSGCFCDTECVNLGDCCADACTACGLCSGGARCGPVPAISCRQAGRSMLRVKDVGNDARDVLKWRWRKGEATAVADFLQPDTNAEATYDVCLYGAAAGAQPVWGGNVLAASACRGKPCWKETRNGFVFKNRQAAPDGIKVLKLRAGESNKAQLQVLAKGVNVAPPALPLDLPVTVQLIVQDGATATCWEARYSAATVNDVGRFKARAP